MKPQSSQPIEPNNNRLSPPHIILTLSCTIIFLILCCPSATPSPPPVRTATPTLIVTVAPSATAPLPAPTNTLIPTSPPPTDTPIPTIAPIPTDTPPPPASGCPYVGNSNTKKFHHASCSSVDQIKPEHKVCFPTREEAIANGYQPCARCNP